MTRMEKYKDLRASILKMKDDKPLTKSEITSSKVEEIKKKSEDKEVLAVSDILDTYKEYDDKKTTNPYVQIAKRKKFQFWLAIGSCVLILIGLLILLILYCKGVI